MPKQVYPVASMAAFKLSLFTAPLCQEGGFLFVIMPGHARRSSYVLKPRAPAQTIGAIKPGYL